MSDVTSFFDFCRRAVGRTRHRAKAKGIPCGIDFYFLSDLLVDQEYCCAVTAIPLEPPLAGAALHPFGPSLDRISPQLGYVPGNVRIVCNMVNSAMNVWGARALHRMVDMMIGADRRLKAIKRRTAKRQLRVRRVNNRVAFAEAMRS
jgi:hypothetical protein